MCVRTNKNVRLVDHHPLDVEKADLGPLHNLLPPT